ncbi:MAG: putative zinc-binding protein [Promethearchaeota archaeon]
MPKFLETMRPTKVGIIACSGEALPEGTVTRIAARLVVEELRPDDTVIMCLPLFLAGDEGEQNFAKVFPTITIDGCEKLCSEKGTEKYSGKPTATIYVREIMKAMNMKLIPEEVIELGSEGMKFARKIAEITAVKVDEILNHIREKDA